MQLAIVVVDANEIELPDSPTEALVIDKIESSFLRSYGQLEAPTAGKEPSKMSKSGGVLAALTGSHGQLYAQSKSKLGGRGSLVGGPSDGAPPAAPAAGEDAGADGAPEGGRKKKKRVLGRVANKRAKEKRMAGNKWCSLRQRRGKPRDLAVERRAKCEQRSHLSGHRRCGGRQRGD